MKILKYISEEIVPLSRKQNLVLLIIITCVFQFVLFYAPALADQAVKEAQAQEIGLNYSDSNDFNLNDVTIINHDNDEKVGKIETASSTEASISSSTKVIIDGSNATTTATSSSIKVKVKTTSQHVITAYNSEVGQTDNTPCSTANGYDLCKNNTEDSIAANFLKFGTKVRIPELFGDRIFVVRDRMNARHATRVDVWMKNHSDAMKFGVKTAKIEVLE